MKMVFWVLAALFGFAGSSFAETVQPQPTDALGWLQKMAVAAHGLNYIGTFVYQRDNRTETSRIVHLADEAGEHEKLEVLDGPPREIIRNNDEILCYLPESKSILTNKLKLGKSFPALLPKNFSGVSENYVVKLGGRERIAGRECQIILLDPRDAFRYGHKICADSKTGLPLKASMLNEKNDLVDQFTFTQIAINVFVDQGLLKPSFALKKTGNGVAAGEAMPADDGWAVSQAPAGFKKVMAMKRMLPGKKMPVNHLVFSDELVAVSVFIEPLANVEKPVNGLTSQGAINVYGKPVAAHQVTVLGEVPAVTVVQIGNSVIYKGK